MDGTWLLVVGGWTDVMMKIRHQRKSQLHITVLQLSVFEGTIARGLTITQTICDRANHKGAENASHSEREAWTQNSVTMT